MLVAVRVPWLNTVIVKVTVEPDTNGVDDPVVNTFLNARSNTSISPAAEPVLAIISLSPHPQLIHAVFEKFVPPLPVILKEMVINQVVPPVNGLKNQLICLLVGSRPS